MEVNSALYKWNEESLYFAINIKCRTVHKQLTDKKEVIFVIDLSASMEDSIPQLKASLLALNETIDSYIDIKIIGFSDNAWKIYPNGNKTFVECVEDIKCLNLTDGGAGLELAFNEKNQDKFTWIIYMSDGYNNIGKYQTEASITTLINTKPEKTKVISIGYGDGFDVDTLNIIGDFTYMREPEMIPQVFGSISHEIMTSWIYDLTVHCKFNNNPIVGEKNIGIIYSERQYTCMWKIKNFKSEYTPIVKYRLIDTDFENSITMNCENDAIKIPSEIKRKYYEASKGRKFLRIYKIMMLKLNAKKEINNIKKLLEEWTDEESFESKQELLTFMDKITNDNSTIFKSLELVKNCSSQSSHTNRNYYTPSQKTEVNNHIRKSQRYLIDSS